MIFAIGCIHNLKGQQEVLVVRLNTVENEVYTKDNIPIKVLFENKGQSVCRLLNKFDRAQVFLRFKMTRYDGTPIMVEGGGKITFSSTNPPSYIELNSEESHAIIINIAELVLKDKYTQTIFDEGSYSLSVKYFNQYGENCFKGRVESEPISVFIHGS